MTVNGIRYIKYIVIGAFVFSLLGILTLNLTAKVWRKQEPRPFSMIEQDEGFFPLYEKDFTKTISIDKHPYTCRFFIFIKTPSPSELNLDNVILKLEAIKNEEIIGAQLIHGSTFCKFSSTSDLMHYAIAIAYNKRARDFSSTDKTNAPHETVMRCFKLREPGIYRLTVVQPCEKYEYAKSELRTARGY